MTVLAIDAGTTGITALLVGEDGRVRHRAYREFPQYFPEPGRVEHDPEEIWRATLAACVEVLAGHPAPAAIGIANQRETVVAWDRATLRAPRRALVWQDRRSAAWCEEHRGIEPELRTRTGLPMDPYFSATKLAWLATAEPETWAGLCSGALAWGTVDTYLLARLTGGARYVTDHTNACRTLLYDLHTGDWSPELVDLLGVAGPALPELVPSYGPLATTSPADFLGLTVPVTGIAGDQQAALVGQAGFAAGDSKCTYGTGSFLLTHTGDRIVSSAAGLLSTVALAAPDGARTFALEGSVFVSGAAVQWLRDGLGLIAAAAETEELGRSVPDAGGCVFVPALTGLGAPYWDPGARGAILGVTRGTTRAHLVRATLEAMAQSVHDVVEVLDVAPATLRVDGGASANDLLMELQAQVLGVPVERPAQLQTTGLGAAYLAGLGAGIWSTYEEVAATWALERRFDPAPPDPAGRRRWLAAVECSRDWSRAASGGDWI